LPFQAYKEAAELYAAEKVNEERDKIIEDITLRMNEIESNPLPNDCHVIRAQGLEIAINMVKNRKP